MAKGSSSQQGVDPLGIGVPQYARSSYDPIETARRAWSDFASNKAAPDKERKKEYDDWVNKNIPTPDAWEQKTAEELSNETLEFSQEVEQSFRQGEFDPFKPGEKGTSFQKRANDIKNKSNLYKSLGEMYKNEYRTLRAPANFEKIDHELTKENFDNFINEPDIQKKADKIMEPLVVFKPEPVEVMNELKSAVGYVFQGGLDKEITKDSFDPRTGMIKVESLEGMSPEKLETGMRKVWNMMSPRVKKEFERRYADAPRSQKIAVEDDAEIPISTEDWFISQHSPEYAKKMNISYVRKPDGSASFSWGTYLPGKNEEGKFELQPMTKTFGRIGADSKSTIAEFNSEHSIPLQQVFTRSFPMQVSRQTKDNETGKSVEQAAVADTQPVSVEFAPIAPKTMTYTDQQGKPWTFEAGDIIPKDIQAEMDLSGKGDLYEFEAFVISAVDYNKQQTVIQVGETSLPGKTKSFAKTNRMPYREAVTYMSAAASSMKMDLKPLTAAVDEILFELNGKTNKLKKTQDVDAAYDELFNK